MPLILLQTSTYHSPLLDLEVVFITLKKQCQKHFLLALKAGHVKGIRRAVGKSRAGMCFKSCICYRWVMALGSSSWGKFCAGRAQPWRVYKIKINEINPLPQTRLYFRFKERKKKNAFMSLCQLCWENNFLNVYFKWSCMICLCRKVIIFMTNTFTEFSLNSKTSISSSC